MQFRVRISPLWSSGKVKTLTQRSPVRFRAELEFLINNFSLTLGGVVEQFLFQIYLG